MLDNPGNPSCAHGWLCGRRHRLRSHVRSRSRFRSQSRAGETEQGRKQGDRDSDTDEHREGGSDSHGAEEGNTHDKQTEQSDDDGNAREHYGASRRADCHRDRLFGLFSSSELGAMSRQNEQGVVDPDGEPDHECEHRCGARDARECRDGNDSAHNNSHANEGREKREPCCEE